MDEYHDNNKFTCEFCNRDYNIKILKEMCDKRKHKDSLKKKNKLTNKLNTTVTINDNNNTSLKCYYCEQDLKQLKELDQRNSFKLKV